MTYVRVMQIIAAVVFIVGMTILALNIVPQLMYQGDDCGSVCEI